MARFYKTCGILLRIYFFQIGQTICKVCRNISLFLAQRCSHDSFKYLGWRALQQWVTAIVAMFSILDVKGLHLYGPYIIT